MDLLGETFHGILFKISNRIHTTCYPPSFLIFLSTTNNNISALTGSGDKLFSEEENTHSQQKFGKFLSGLCSREESISQEKGMTSYIKYC